MDFIERECELKYWRDKWQRLQDMPYKDKRAMKAKDLSFNADADFGEFCLMFDMNMADQLSLAVYRGYLNVLNRGDDLSPYEEDFLRLKVDHAAYARRKALAENVIKNIKEDGDLEEFELKFAVYGEFTEKIAAELYARGFRKQDGTFSWRKEGCLISA